jgi:hypothetical protein
MKDNEQKTKELFLIAMNAVLTMKRAVDKFDGIGFDVERQPLNTLTNGMDRIIYGINQALELKKFILDETAVDWWYSHYLTGDVPKVITEDKEIIVDTPEKLWELMRENGEV